MTYAIGLDIGGTNVKAVAVGDDARVLARRDVPTKDDAAGTWKADARAVVKEMEEQLGRAEAVGVCSPGIAAQDGRSIWWMIGKMEASQGFEWRQWLGREREVPVWNDAQAALLAETWCGAAAGCRNAVLLTLGTGVGGALLVDGHLLRGHLGRAGHLGHMTVDPDGPMDLANTPGAIEWAIGEYSVKERSGGRYASTRALVEAHRAGDDQASAVWLRSVKALAAHMVGVINAVDPEVVIIGGGIAQAGDALFGPLEQWMDKWEWRPHGKRVRVVPAKLGADAGALGAAFGALDAESVATCRDDGGTAEAQ